MPEPILRVGLLPGTQEAELQLDGFHAVRADGAFAGEAPPGAVLVATAEGNAIRLSDPDGEWVVIGRRIKLVPKPLAECSFTLRGVTVGLHFHWEHEEDLAYRGTVALESHGLHFDVIDELPLEEYLVSVISSEMSARCPADLLRAHAVISRSWLMAQLHRAKQQTLPFGYGIERIAEARDGAPEEVRILRWYDREDHQDFDVCADDHCQRYQGIARITEAAAAAVELTRGEVLVSGDRICDARFSKCCGGMTELFASAWGDEEDAPYLQAFPDTAAGEAPFALPLTDEDHATAFIEGEPEVWCNTEDRDLLERLLPAIDHDTRDFFRWTVTLDQDQLQRLVREKSGIRTGPIHAMRALKRGPSGRITLLGIDGERCRLQVGKELEIRRLLSETHLYSSAFTVHPDGRSGAVPARFVLRGAGWGHGVGLCQIGAAVMAEHGVSYQEILAHYYRGAELETRY